MIPKNIIEQAVAEKLNGFAKNSELVATTRDVFNARLQTYISETEKWLEVAVIGEIGNNTFDHNFQFIPEYPRGALRYRSRQSRFYTTNFRTISGAARKRFEIRTGNRPE